MVDTMLFKLVYLSLEVSSNINILFMIPISCLDFDFYMTYGSSLNIKSRIKCKANIVFKKVLNFKKSF